ncbi:hypothetical protein [Psychromonas sp.]|uniref:hypothetical protein n=1 Tax=Psychromonas sp. TaxID=1884585 RepID=UPI0039E3C9D9
MTDAIYSAGFGAINRGYGQSTRNIGMTTKAYRWRLERKRILLDKADSTLKCITAKQL